MEDSLLPRPFSFVTSEGKEFLEWKEGARERMRSEKRGFSRAAVIAI